MSKFEVNNLIRILQQSYVKEDDRANVVFGYVYDRNNSTDKIAIYHDDKTVFFCIRGTRPTSLQDIRTDALIYYGIEKFSMWYRHVNQMFQKIKRLYPNHYMVTLSHSLGSSMNRLLFDSYYKEIDEAHLFSTGTGFPQGMSAITGVISCQVNDSEKCKAERTKRFMYRGKYDVISLLSKYELANENSTLSTPNPITSHMLGELVQ